MDFLVSELAGEYKKKIEIKVYFFTNVSNRSGHYQGITANKVENIYIDVFKFIK